MSIKAKPGYTLVELMVVVALLSILVVSVIGMFLTLLKTGGATQALARVKEEGDYASITLERIIRGGNDYSSCNPGPSGTLVFAVPSVSGGPDVSHTISLVSNKINLNDGVNRELTSSKVRVTQLDFTCTPKTTTHGAVVKTTFSIEANGLNGPETFTSTVIMRNY